MLDHPRIVKYLIKLKNYLRKVVTSHFFLFKISFSIKQNLTKMFLPFFGLFNVTFVWILKHIFWLSCIQKTKKFRLASHPHQNKLRFSRILLVEGHLPGIRDVGLKRAKWSNIVTFPAQGAAITHPCSNKVTSWLF